MTNFYKVFLLLASLFSANALALDKLELMVRTSYPKDMKKVGEAVEFVIEPFGYTLIRNSRIAPDAGKIANMPLMPLAREIRTMPVYDAIQVLIGPDNTILVDHPNKLISFQKGVDDES